MTSSMLECLGLATPGDDGFSDLVMGIKHLVHGVCRIDGVMLVHYTDPTGVRLNMEFPRDGDIAEVMPSYVAPPGADLRRISPAGGQGLVVASVEDDLGGEAEPEDVIEIQLACHLVQWRLIGRSPVDASAAITAFGLDVVVHDDAAAFVAARPPGSIPYGTDTFIPTGLFGEGPIAASAQLHGTVLSTVTHTVELTGQSFHACRVQTAGFQAEVVLAASAHPTAPEPGAVIAGSVAMVADAPDLVRIKQRRSWLRRSR